jgi:hypothetical protein
MTGHIDVVTAGLARWSSEIVDARSQLAGQVVGR